METQDNNNPVAGMPILVIEDEVKVHEVLKLQAQKEGLNFTFAKNGREGIDQLRSAETPFAAVLLDIHMPETDGFWFLEEKKKDPALNNIPVVIFTNLSNPDLIKRATDLGVKGYLVKAHHSIQNVMQEVKKCANGETCSIDWH